MAGLKDGSILAVKEAVYCLNPARTTRPLPSTKRWARFIEHGTPDRVTYVAEDGEMATPMAVSAAIRRHGNLIQVRSFLPVTFGAIGETHALGLESLLKAA
jgi:hypothetical protein